MCCHDIHVPVPAVQLDSLQIFICETTSCVKWDVEPFSVTFLRKLFIYYSVWDGSLETSN